ncbi:YceI family protein [Aequorivita marisscotiae]|uniref:YceI family protein n=1 Tax=Aequorivita marisscotiae TaxID=3040348 RepID=A0ABY8KQ45_9FLAO|nr:YceI family protein [Aequorivita sp. Ant34-E75]WGF91593.1 YceI family protein [Aequorivita sp. Ant34-E75]
MNRFGLYCLVFMFSLNGWAQNDFITKSIEILAGSELSIKGDTNISEFGCEFSTYYLEECREVVYKRIGNNIHFKNAVLSLKNKGFNCGHKIINKDFHALLNTKEYPNITLELNEITFNKSNEKVAHVLITIAGTQKEYTFPIDVISSSLNRFVGKLKLNINDFNLEPPKKMFGLIVIKDEIEIDFNLVARL